MEIFHEDDAEAQQRRKKLDLLIIRALMSARVKELENDLDQLCSGKARRNMCLNCQNTKEMKVFSSSNAVAASRSTIAPRSVFAR